MINSAISIEASAHIKLKYYILYIKINFDDIKLYQIILFKLSLSIISNFIGFC